MRADRLGRSTSHLLKIMEDLKKRGVQVVFTEQPELSTNTPQGKLLLAILAAIAEFETALRAERQAEGIAKAKQKGIRLASVRSTCKKLSFGVTGIPTATPERTPRCRAGGKIAP